MYLDHFGLKEPPFKITPVTDFFFPGANRAEILDALLYAITDSEGIIKVTGEVGSGKTMLCRMLLERFPEHVEAVYLANPSLSREEMLYAIADALKLNLEGQRVNIILQTLQNHLELKIAQGKRVVILVDEAHAMPLETMEELRLLYNLQVGNHKLMHIVLVGQPELNDKLNQPNMRQLKDRIIHHFSMLPLSPNIIESYLRFSGAAREDDLFLVGLDQFRDLLPGVFDGFFRGPSEGMVAAGRVPKFLDEIGEHGVQYAWIHGCRGVIVQENWQFHRSTPCAAGD